MSNVSQPAQWGGAEEQQWQQEERRARAPADQTPVFDIFLDRS